MSCKVDIACAHCGKVFSLYRSQTSRGRGRFCSVTCGVRANGGTSEVRPCAACGRDFKVKGSSIARGRRFCSSRCCVRSGRHSSNWKGGIWSGDRRAYAHVATERRRAAIVGATVGDGVTLEQWRAICVRFGHTCPCCRRHASECGGLTMDHIVPLSKGGLHMASNIQPLCQSCNSTKGRRLIGFDPDGGGVEVTDIRALIAAIVNGDAPLDSLEINWLFINQLAAQQQGAFAMPGFESFEEVLAVTPEQRHEARELHQPDDRARRQPAHRGRLA